MKKTGDKSELDITGSDNTYTGAITIGTGNKLTAKASQLTGAISNSGTLTLTGNGNIGNDISGEGTLKVAGDMFVNADNLQTSTTLVESGKTLTITGGTFDKRIGGDGTLNITGTLHFGNNAELVQTGTQTVGEIPVSGVSVILAGGGTFDVRDRENTTGGCINTLTFDGGRIDASGGHVGNMLVVDNLKITENGGSISFDVSATDNDKIGVLTSVSVVGNSTLKLDSINVVGELSGNSGSIEFVKNLLDKKDSSGNSILTNLTIAGQTTTMSGNYMYTFTQDATDKGKLNYTKAMGMGLKQVIQAEKGTDGQQSYDYGNVDTYSFTGDQGKNFEPYSANKIAQLAQLTDETEKTKAVNLNNRFGNLGTMEHATNATSRTLTIVGNGSELSGGTHEGVIVRNGDTLVLKNISAITDAKDNTIATNHGTVKFTGSGTTDVRATIQGEEGKLIVDGVNVVLGENYQYVKSRQQLTTEELATLMNKTDKTKIEQKEYEFGWKLDDDGSYVTTLSENTSASITQKYLEILSGSLTANADNLDIRGNIVNNGEMIFTGGTLAKAVTGTGNLTFDGNVSTNADYIGVSGKNTVNAGRNLTLLGGTLNKVIGGKGNVTIGNGTDVQTVSADAGNFTNTGNLTVNTKGTLTLTAGAVNRTITNNGIVKLNGATLGGAYVKGGTLEFAKTAAYNISFLTGATNKIDSGVTLALSGGTVGNTANIENQGTVDLISGTYDENFITNAKDDGTLNLKGEAVYQTTAGKVFTEGDATKENSGAVTDAAKNKINFIAGTLTLTDELYSLNYLLSAQNSLKAVEINKVASATKLVMLGTMKGGTISIDDIGNLSPDIVLDKVVVETGENPTIEKGFSAKGLKLAEGSESVTITSDTPVTLGGTEGGTIIKVGENENIPVNVAVGNTEKSATLNIGNEAVSPDTEYRLPGSVNITGAASKMNVRGQMEITEKLNMAGGEVAVAEGASLNVPEINVTDDAQMSGKVETGKLAGKSGKVITVGNANAAGHVTAKETQLKGGTLFLDPMWKDGVGIEGASNFATETTTLDGKYIAGQNSVISFGTNDGNDVVNFVNRSNSGIDWSESGITAAAYVADNINVANGSLTVDGSLTEESNPLPDPSNGSVTLKDKSLLMVNTRNLTNDTAITGVSSLDVTNETGKKATIYLRGARTGQDFYITDAGAGDEDLTNLTLAGLGANFEATPSIEDGKLKVHIDKGSLAILDETVIPNVGNALETDGNEDAAAFLDKVSMMTDDASAVQAVNSVANLGENLGVSRGAYDVANMVGDAIDSHWDSHHEDKDVWAVGTHSKETVDGIELGGMDAQYDAQYNGAVVGVNLSSNFGMAINYTDGKVNNHLGGHNDAEYYGGSIYAKTDWGNLRITADATYTHGKNELSQNGITADAKTDTVSGGLMFKYMAKAGMSKIGPFAGIRYMHIDGKDYTDSLGVNREADKINSVVVPVGLEYTGEFKMPKSEWTWKPVLMAGYLFNLGDRTNDMFLRYNDAMDTFAYDLVDKGAFFAKAGMNFTKNNLTLGVGYDYMKSSNSHNNKWNVNLEYAF